MMFDFREAFTTLFALFAILLVAAIGGGFVWGRSVGFEAGTVEGYRMGQLMTMPAVGADNPPILVHVRFDPVPNPVDGFWLGVQIERGGMIGNWMGFPIKPDGGRHDFHTLRGERLPLTFEIAEAMVRPEA